MKRPDIEQLILSLKRQKADYIPIAELGIHPKIKEQFIGRPIKTLKDDIEFWSNAGYDYIKLQPIVDFNPENFGNIKKSLVEKEGSLTYNWAAQGKGIITNEEEFDKYIFPHKRDNRSGRIGYKKLADKDNNHNSIDHLFHIIGRISNTKDGILSSGEQEPRNQPNGSPSRAFLPGEKRDRGHHIPYT